MIATFKVRNFRSIKEEQVLSFIPTRDSSMIDTYTEEVADGVRLLKMATIYGANASGKTNILLALDFFSKFMTEKSLGKGEHTGAVPFLMDKESRTEPTSFEMVFFLKTKKYRLSLSMDRHAVLSETLHMYSSPQPTLLYRREYDRRTDSPNIVFGTGSMLRKKDRDTVSGNTINNRAVIAAFGISNVGASPIDDVYEMFSRKVAPVMLPSMSLTSFTKAYMRNSGSATLKNFVLRFLKASDFNISDVSVDEDAEEEGVLFAHHTDAGTVVMGEALESSGTKRYLGLATILYDLLVRGTVLPVDEMETSIHYELLSYFIKVFLANSRRQAQLIFTTHDVNLLDEDYIRRDVIWFTEKDGNGETSLSRLSSMGLHKNQSVYNAYRQDKLVDLPFTGSIYLDMDKYYGAENG